MALFNCPECNREISDKAEKCPHCGFPINAQPDISDSKNEAPSSNSSARKKEKNKTPWYLKFIWFIVAAFFVIIFAIGINSFFQCEAAGCNKYKVSGGKYCSEHTCAASGCYNYVSSSSLYCYNHSYSSYSSYPSYTPTERASDVLKFSNLTVTSNSSYNICTGSLTNNGKETYYFVEVKGAFKDSSGTVLDTDWTYAVGSEGLAPGESTTFRLSVTKNSKIKSCSVSLLDYDTKK